MLGIYRLVSVCVLLMNDLGDGRPVSQGGNVTVAVGEGVAVTSQIQPSGLLELELEVEGATIILVLMIVTLPPAPVLVIMLLL